MNDNKYTTAGWLALAQAILFPTALFVGILQGIIGVRAFGYTGPTFGPSDFMFILANAFTVYTFLKFRELLHEHYDYHGADTIIAVMIWWTILVQILSLVVRGVLLAIWPVSETSMLFIQGSTLVTGAVSAGIIDLIFGIKLLKIKDMLSDLVKAYAILALISGIMEMAVVLIPLVGFLMVPASGIVLSLIFFRARQQVEFV